MRFKRIYLVSIILLVVTGIVLLENKERLLIHFVQQQAVPYALKNLNADDIAVACVITGGFDLFIQNLATDTKAAHQLAALFGFLTGNCIEFKAMEEELRSLRALHNKNVIEAQDARIKQKKFLSQAARRQLSGFNKLASAFNQDPGSGCPTFKTRQDAFYWLIGLVSGLQAVMNDLASEGNAKVPLDIALKVGRGASCLDNEQWWGLPTAIQAAIWVSFPGTKPAGSNPLQILNQAMQTGLQQGMRISQVLAARIYIGLGNIEAVKSIIRRHKKERAQVPAILEYHFLDEVASRQLHDISDHLWTEAIGMRTPLGGLGEFWDDPGKSIETINIEDIL